MARDSLVNYTADDLFSSTGIGSLDKAIGLNFSGINYNSAPTLAPRNKEQPGYVFFTRPQLNMQGDNIRNVRLFYNLLSDNPYSQESAIRAILDPRLAMGYKHGNILYPAVTVPRAVVDNENCFIPALTNNLENLSGWPEETMTFQRSKEDVFRGTHTQPNGITEIHSSFTLTGTFRNTFNNPLIKMMHYWMSYMGHTTTTGKLRPYPDYESMNILDCNTRIYRIILDAQRERVTQIYACGAALPSANAVTSAADYNRSSTLIDSNKDLTLSFECDGMIILDPILFHTFNGVVQTFCPGMRDEYRDRTMVRLSKLERDFFPNLGYPRIDPQTSMFEIWVTRQDYESRQAQVSTLMGFDDMDSETS